MLILAAGAIAPLDTAVSEPLTPAIALRILCTPLTWLPCVAYLTTFGYELAIDANLANVLFGLYKTRKLGQTNAGYVAAIYGLLNVFTRPLGEFSAIRTVCDG